MSELVVVAPLRIEALAVRGKVTVVGMGRSKARLAGAELAKAEQAKAERPVGGAPASPVSAVAVVGLAGGLQPKLRPGDLVVATEIRSVDGSIARALPGAELIAAELRRAGAAVHAGPIVSSPKLVRSKRQRHELAATGAMAVDMESAWLVDQLGDHSPVAVVRSISDTADHGMVCNGARAMAALTRVRRSLEQWSTALGGRDIVLTAPRSFCAGVERAIEIVERAVSRFGAPVYVRRQIVHNTHVVASLERKGAIFIEEIDEAPPGAVVVLAAHGVSPQVRQDANRRSDLRVIDATCPLVAKVHYEVRRYADQDFQIALIGHPEHEEIIGTIGEAPDRISLVEEVEDVARLRFEPGTKIAYLTQTTLATDETATIVTALRERFPQLVGPSSHDICYATQNRQDAVRAVAGRCDLMLVVGSPNSSNTMRLVEVARRHGCRAELVEDWTQLRLAWFDGIATVGIAAGASAPEALVRQLVEVIGELGPARVEEYRTVQETVRFSLPQQVR